MVRDLALLLAAVLAAPAAPAAPARYTGVDACATYHQEVAASWRRTRHARAAAWRRIAH